MPSSTGADSSGYGGGTPRKSCRMAADTVAAKPQATALVEQLGETGHLAVLEGNEAVTVDFVDGWPSPDDGSAPSEEAQQEQEAR